MKKSNGMIFLTLIFVVALLGGCATDATPTPPTSIPPSPIPPTPVGPKNPFPNLTEWDLVIIGDSTISDIGRYYAGYIQEDMNVTVKVHNEVRGGLSAYTLLELLQNDQRLRSVVQDAEVVVYYGNPEGSAAGDWSCIPFATHVNDCSPETFAGYQAKLEAIVREILALRDGVPTIIRATETYIPILKQWQGAGLELACTQCVENMNQAVRQAAAAYNIPVADIYNTFNGLDHYEDPNDKGYIQVDGQHTTVLGKQVIAGLLRDLGYDPVMP